ncbi:condensation domain-containing protein, partial [Paenibacillus elgii]
MAITMGGASDMTNTNRFPLTQAQQRIWYTELLYPNTSVSLLLATTKMKGKINMDAFKRSIHMLIRDNDSFRTRITAENGIPQQYVVPFEEAEIQYLDISDFESPAQLEEWLEQFRQTPMELFDSPLYQFVFINIDENEYWFTMKVHHIISDGISMGIFVEKITENYLSLLKGEEPQPTELYSYIDYIETEQSYEQSERYQKDRAYWLDKFSYLPEITGLKAYNPLTLSTEAKRVEFTVDTVLYNDLKVFCKENNIGLFSFFMALMYIYIHKVTNQQDIVIGASYANRTTKKEKNTMGMFVSTVAARENVDPELGLLGFIQRVSKEQISMLRHQRYPYNQLIQDLRALHHSTDLQRLFGISMEYRQLDREDMGGVEIQTDYNFNGEEVNDMLLRIVELLDEHRLVFNVDYRTHLFEETEIAGLIQHLLTIAKYMIYTPHQKISDLSLISEEEKHTILTLFNDTAAEYPREKTIHELFEEQVERTPEHVAVVFEGSELTYRELNEQANRLARVLRAEGVEAEQKVGLMVERSLEMMIGVYGILKAGGAYVPIDPSLPEERIRFMLEDSGAQVLLTQGHLQERVSFEGKRV